MTLLTKSDLQKLDKEIDSSVATQSLLSQPRDLALIHLLRYFEDYVRLYALKTLADRGREAYLVTLKNGQDGMHFAVQWIFQHCPLPVTKTEYKTRNVIYQQAHDLHESAMNYSMVWSLMSMVLGKKATAERDRDGIIHIHYANQLVADVEVADRLISAPDSPETKRDHRLSDLAAAPSVFLKDVKIRAVGAGKVMYDFPTSVFDRIADDQRQMQSPLWELDGKWNLGDYTISQFREFWVALITLCWIHHWVCVSSSIVGGSIVGGALDSVIMLARRKRWVNYLTKYSGLDVDIVEPILEDLIYETSLYESGQKQPDVTYQPFFRLDTDLLVLSNWLVLLSNAERNMWDLVSIKRPEIHSGLRNEKGRLWLAELKPLLKSYGLDPYGPIKFSFGSKSSDLDLLVFDHTAKFGLGCQLKWLTTPDRIRDVKYTEHELEKGLTQAELSLRWLNSLPVELPRMTGLASDELREYEFQAVVLSKNTIGSGWVHKHGIPIVNERLLTWLLGNPHRKRLRTLWQVGEGRRYLPKRGKHFDDKDIPVSFGNISFLGERMGAILIGAWDPANDIDLTGLS